MTASEMTRTELRRGGMSKKGIILVCYDRHKGSNYVANIFRAVIYSNCIYWYTSNWLIHFVSFNHSLYIGMISFKLIFHQKTNIKYAAVISKKQKDHVRTGISEDNCFWFFLFLGGIFDKWIKLFWKSFIPNIWNM